MIFLPKNGISTLFRPTLIWIFAVYLLCYSVCESLEGVNFVDVSCSFANITADITFHDIFKGVVFPEGNFFNPECKFSAPDAGTKNMSIFLPLTECGNLIREKNGNIYVSNNIVVQKYSNIQTDSDIVYKTSCKLPQFKVLHMPEFFHERHPTRVRSEELEAYMDFQHNGRILGFNTSNKLHIGDEFIVVIHVKDGGIHNDIQVEGCWAYEGETIEESRYVLQIYDMFKCENQWIPGFNLTKNMENVSNSTLQGNLKAFKFPLSNNLHITCSVEACTQMCYRNCDQNYEEFSQHSKVKRSIPERYRLMKATIKALGTRLMERNRKLSENNANFHRRSTHREFKTLIDDDTDDNVNPTELVYNEISTFNVTNNVVVYKRQEINLKHESSNISPLLKTDCVSKLRFGIITGILGFIIFCLILVCIGFMLNIRKEKKKKHIDGFLLYNLY